MNLGITGASGFVGGAMARAFADAGWNVVPLGRRETRHYDLREPVSPGTLSGLDVVLHAAYDPQADNLAAAGLLYAAALEAGTRFAFVSSFAAGPDARSAYGREKYRVEQMLDATRDLIVRPGLVAGSGGLYGAMRRAVLRFGVAPVFGDGMQPVYLVDPRELAGATVALVAGGASGTFACAAPEPIAFGALCVAIAEAGGKRALRVCVSTGAALGAISLAERLGLRLPISSESVRGIANLTRVDVPRYPQVPFAFSSPIDVVRRAEATA
jgi:NADH dehydrogenase